MLVIQLLKSKLNTKKITAVMIVLILFAVVFFIMPNIAGAQDDLVTETQALGETAGFSQQPLPVIIGNIIRIFLGFLGVVLLIIIIYGGFLYMTSGGEPDKVSKARKWIVNGIIGLVICLSAFAITSFIISKLNEAFGLSGGGDGIQTEFKNPGLASGALGSVIKEHYPFPNANVPRNTIIMVTFKQEIEPESIMGDDIVCDEDGCSGSLDSDAIQIYRACDSLYPDDAYIPEEYNYDEARGQTQTCNQWKGLPPDDESLFITEGQITTTADNKTFIFNPYGFTDQHLGSANEDVSYIVNLTNNIQNQETNTGVFTGLAQASYSWNFTTTTQIDNSSPFITAVYPVTLDENKQAVPASLDDEGFVRNTKIRIDFSEPILPLGFQNLDFNSTDEMLASNAEILIYSPNLEQPIIGDFITSINQYRSVVFEPKGSCIEGEELQNACGGAIYCLPGETIIRVQVNSVTTDKLLEGIGPQISVAYPAGGIVDAAFNALDTDGLLGKGNGQTQGVEDNYIWIFKTSDQFDVTPPTINSVEPEFGADKSDGVTPDVEIKAVFSEEINPATSTSNNLSIYSPDWSGWVTGSLLCIEQVDEDGETYCNTDAKTVVINHGDFPLAQIGETEVPMIYPKITSGIEDMNGNCFNPCDGPGCDGVAAGQACCAETVNEEIQQVIREGDECSY